MRLDWLDILHFHHRRAGTHSKVCNGIGEFFAGAKRRGSETIAGDGL
jgi:hypothetical protein